MQDSVVRTKYDKDCIAMLSWISPECEIFHEELHNMGLPTIKEAIESGMTIKEWNQLLRDRGALEFDGRE